MTTVYTLEVIPHVSVQAGAMNLKISGKPTTFCFGTLEERQPLLDLARAKGWSHTTDVLTTTTAASALDFLQRDYAQLRESLHLPPDALTAPEGER